MAGWHHQLDVRESEWILGIGDGQGGLVSCDSWGPQIVGHDWVTELNWNEMNESKIVKYWYKNKHKKHWNIIESSEIDLKIWIVLQK